MVIIIAIPTTWVFNLLKLTECNFEPDLKCEIVHSIGLVPLLSAVTIWFLVINRGIKMKQNKRKLKQVVKDALVVIQSGKSPTSTKKGPGRVHVDGYGRKAKEVVRGSLPNSIDKTYKDFL